MCTLGEGVQKGVGKFLKYFGRIYTPVHFIKYVINQGGVGGYENTGRYAHFSTVGGSQNL